MSKLRLTFISIFAAIATFFGWQLWAASAGLAWTNPTTYVGSGGTIGAGELATNRIYRKVDNGSYSIYQSIPVGSAFSDSNLTTGTYCYKVSVVTTAGVESDQSNEACKAVDTRKPNAPINLTVN